MNRDNGRPLEYVVSCRDVPEHRDPVEPTFAPELKPGFVLDDRFVLAEPISRSGMATIYKAEDRRRNEVVAVKVPHLRYESDPTYFSQFEREDQIGQKLQHPFVLRFVPVEWKKSRPYIVTEYLRGSTLAHVLDRTRPLPEKDALRIASLLCDALQHLHSHGVVHRDLKPGNVMICCDRTLRLMDFGIASAPGVRRVTLSRLGTSIGTPDYMAPEQVMAKRADARTDIYSLGAVLYEMLSGATPFPHENPWISMNNRVTGDPVAPRKLVPEISREAEEIVLHAMQRDPADRYPSAAAFKADLDAPDGVTVTGYCNRLHAPRWKFGWRTTPVLAGTVAGFGFISIQVLAFLLLRHLLAK